MTHAVYADIIRPAARIPRAVYTSVLVAGFSLLVALSAQVAIPLPFTPVPVTLQTLMVLATGALLGSRRGAAAILLYIAEGAAGLPVFAMGRSGPAHLAGPLGGYLLGFVAAAFLAGLICERGWDSNGLLAFAGLVLADLAIYVPGPALARRVHGLLPRALPGRPAVPRRGRPEGRGVRRAAARGMEVPGGHPGRGR